LSAPATIAVADPGSIINIAVAIASNINTQQKLLTSNNNYCWLLL